MTCEWRDTNLTARSLWKRD